MPNHDRPRSKLITRVGRVFLFGSTALITITISQLLVLFGATAPHAASAQTYAGIGESTIFVAVMLLLYSLTLGLSFALLKRVAWARPAFIGVLGVGIVLNALKLGVGVFVAEPHPAPDEGPAPFLWIVRAATVLDVLLPLGLIAVFAWLIIKLSDAGVRAEFGDS